MLAAEFLYGFQLLKQIVFNICLIPELVHYCTFKTSKPNFAMREETDWLISKKSYSSIGKDIIGCKNIKRSKTLNRSSCRSGVGWDSAFGNSFIDGIGQCLCVYISNVAEAQGISSQLNFWGLLSLIRSSNSSRGITDVVFSTL